MRGGAGNGILKDGGLAVWSLLPVAPGDFALRGVGEDHTEGRAELAAGDESALLMPDGRVLAGKPAFAFVTDGNFLAGTVDEVQARARGPLAFGRDVGAVVVVEGGAGGEEVGQAWQGFNYILMSGAEDVLLSGVVWSRPGGQLAGRGIQEGGSIR